MHTNQLINQSFPSLSQGAGQGLAYSSVACAVRLHRSVHSLGWICSQGLHHAGCFYSVTDQNEMGRAEGQSDSVTFCYFTQYSTLGACSPSLAHGR